MFRLWAKVWKENRLWKDMVVCNEQEDMTRTKKIFAALDTVCEEFDLAHPIWLDSTIAEFKRFDKVSFGKDNFVESIEFDYLEIQVIEEDGW